MRSIPLDPETIQSYFVRTPSGLRWTPEAHLICGWDRVGELVELVTRQGQRYVRLGNYLLNIHLLEYVVDHGKWPN